MEGFERVCADNMHKKIEEVERSLHDQHTREMQSLTERVELHYQTNYIEIKEHESIVQD